MTLTEFDNFIEFARQEFLDNKLKENLKTIEEWPKWKRDCIETYFNQSNNKS